MYVCMCMKMLLQPFNYGFDSERSRRDCSRSQLEHEHEVGVLKQHDVRGGRPS